MKEIRIMVAWYSAKKSGAAEQAATAMKTKNKKSKL